VRIVRALDMPVRTRNRSCKYPFADLNVGDAIVIPADEVTRTTANRLRASAHRYTVNNAYSHKYAIRKMPDGAVGVWRVE
jgi:isopenicillin N synthase-like dioxygenase